MHKLQRKAHRFLTRISTKKLFEILNIIDIVDELNIFIKLDKIEKKDRKDFKIAERKKITDRYRKVDFNILETKHRFTLWCLTGTGPFKSFLYNIK